MPALFTAALPNHPASLMGQRRWNKGTTNGRLAYGFGGLTSNKAQMSPGGQCGIGH